jgi:hypothetical protein
MEFVTYEIGKKLQEKGYTHGYNRFGYCPIYSDECTIKYLSDVGAYEEDYYGEHIPCPTIDEVLRWLREEKKIYIIIQPFPTMSTKDKTSWSWSVKKHSDGIDIKHSFLDNNEYISYEQAALAGIKHMLDNLI